MNCGRTSSNYTDPWLLENESDNLKFEWGDPRPWSGIHTLGAIKYLEYEGKNYESD